MGSNLPRALRKLLKCCLYEARCKAYAFLKKYIRSCSYLVMILSMLSVAVTTFLNWNHSSVLHMLALSLIAAVTDKRLSIHIADGETVTIIAFILCHLVVSILHGI
ncbi:hypothetical protein CRE_01773 [Caenorhabditis remanei]|uniref:Uncharacterized protein n=2 Tax=Caenorhabditis remanei TaxID=31234 RepID=E3LFD8_CAERE|nr:hypothetical protein CRE_01773 [Caenorhabditis remanei]